MSDEVLLLEDAEFRFCEDGDLEIDITGTRERWTGVYLTHEQAIQLRDYLTRVLP